MNDKVIAAGNGEYEPPTHILVNEDDPFTCEIQLCDRHGIVRGGPMHYGRDYPCTGHAHFAGEHIRCTSPFHKAQR